MISDSNVKEQRHTSAFSRRSKVESVLKQLTNFDFRACGSGRRAGRRRQIGAPICPSGKSNRAFMSCLTRTRPLL
jgi:hypothetical protein